MKKQVLHIMVMSFILMSCGGSKKSNSSSSKKRVSYSATISKKAQNIIDYAMDYKGTRYRYGGTTKKGMDCSGLVYTAFLTEDIKLPRTSRAMATRGKEINLNQVKEGDLLFFKTSKNKNTINHVGLVVSINNSIQFIHASVSRGVIVSSLDESYWNKCYTKARRLL